MTDRCPLRQQNLDYALYLLTTLFYESWVSDSHLLYPAPMLLIPSSTLCAFFQFCLQNHLLNHLSMFLYYCSHHHHHQLGINQSKLEMNVILLENASSRYFLTLYLVKWKTSTICCMILKFLCWYVNRNNAAFIKVTIKWKVTACKSCEIVVSGC